MEKKPDGFHSLESLFASLAFGDTLRFEVTGKEGDCHLLMNQENCRDTIETQIPKEKNLVFKAVSLFREWTGYNSGLNIRVEKRIPLGAGLGGGSSNAASSLLALNSLSGLDLPMEELLKMAAILGSDVPFFLQGGAAFVSGRGESVESVKFSKKLWVLLLKPPFSSDTAGAYRLLDEARLAGNCERSGKGLSKTALLKALDDDPGTWPFKNDFLPLFLDTALTTDRDTELNSAAYKAIFAAFAEAGASFSGLTGSGSCCFGIFNSQVAAENAEKKLSGVFCPGTSGIGRETNPKKQINFIKLTFFLAHRAIPVLE